MMAYHWVQRQKYLLEVSENRKSTSPENNTHLIQANYYTPVDKYVTHKCCSYVVDVVIVVVVVAVIVVVFATAAVTNRFHTQNQLRLDKFMRSKVFTIMVSFLESYFRYTNTGT